MLNIHTRKNCRNIFNGLALASGMLASSLTVAYAAQDLVIGVPVASIANLDPHGANSNIQGNLQVNAQIFDTLVGFQDGKYVPGLASEWTSSEDATRWTFKLREGVKFSDGSEFDAGDVKASVERVVKLAGPLAGLFKPLKVEAASPNEVRISSDAGQGALLGKLFMLAIAPSEKLADDFGLHPVGSGPFVVESFDPKQGVKLRANKDYWAGAPKLDTVTFRMIPEQAARMTALETGEIQLTWTVPDDQVDALREDSNLKLDTVPTLANVVLWFNTTRMFQDVEVRKALWSAVDFDAIVEALYPNTGQKMIGPLPKAVFGSSEQTPYAYDPEKAKATLEKKGWNFDTTVRILMNNTTYKPLVDAIIADWARIGVKAEVDLQEPAVGTQRLLALDWDISIIQPVITSTGDADYTLGRLYTCAAKRTTYCNPELDKLLVEAGSISDQAKRAELYAAAGKIVWDNAIGMFPIDVKQVWAWRSNLDGVTLDPVYKPDLTQVQFAQ
ncbi:ABC transporter substrate-binding protein [Neorhizobium sp. DT-125]|uniref:ABC transporter substrate-binding protein n=1 Tax=Neorhizobium sp. DT-125 TaxID=3396163 RepID=UPI003F199290